MITRFSTYIAALMLPFSAFAQCEINAPYALNSWSDVVLGLQATGIDAGRVNWGPVEQLCAIYRRSNQPNLFNACRYTKARNSIYFAIDRAQCQSESVAAYPDSLARRRVTQTIVESDKTGPVKQYDLSEKYMTRAELNTSRFANTTSCMQSKGWISAENWMLGKQCE